MKINKAIIYHVHLPLKNFFETSFGRIYEEDHLIVELQGDDIVCFGECPAGLRPDYSYETINTAKHVLKDFILPSIKNKKIESIQQLLECYSWIRGHNMAKMAIESAYWAHTSISQNKPLKGILGGDKNEKRPVPHRRAHVCEHLLQGSYLLILAGHESFFNRPARYLEAHECDQAIDYRGRLYPDHLDEHAAEYAEKEAGNHADPGVNTQFDSRAGRARDLRQQRYVWNQHYRHGPVEKCRKQDSP